LRQDRPPLGPALAAHGGLSILGVCEPVPSADHPAYVDQLAATVEEIGRLSA